jgi:hypothetical protein
MTGRLRLGLVLVGVLAALALPLAATAGPGGKPTFHDHDVFTFTDPDFCGTGEDVVITDTVNAVGWVGETGGDPEQVLQVAFNVRTTFALPDGDVALIAHSAGLFTNEIIFGLEGGVHTHEFVENGLRAHLKLPHGGVLTFDAGSLTYRVTSDEFDNVIDFEIVSVHGPHPAFGSDVFCDVAVEALGL